MPVNWKLLQLFTARTDNGHAVAMNNISGLGFLISDFHCIHDPFRNRLDSYRSDFSGLVRRSYADPVRANCRRFNRLNKSPAFQAAPTLAIKPKTAACICSIIAAPQSRKLNVDRRTARQTKPVRPDHTSLVKTTVRQQNRNYTD
jgi:hypothetical protein